MKKFLLLTLFIIFCISGCTVSETNSNTSINEVSVILPDKETEETVNGYYIPPKNESIKYYANIKTKKFHLKDCVWVSKTNQDNLKGFSNRDKIIMEGYSPCKSCKP